MIVWKSFISRIGNKKINPFNFTTILEENQKRSRKRTNRQEQKSLPVLMKTKVKKAVVGEKLLENKCSVGLKGRYVKQFF